MLKFKTEITKVIPMRGTCSHSQRRFVRYGATKLEEYKPFMLSVQTKMSLLAIGRAEEARGHNCMVIETERRHFVETPVVYGECWG